MNVLVEIVGMLGFVTNVVANILLARKSTTGWVIRLAANVLWLAYGLAIVSIANILSSIVFAGINIYGLRRWRRERFMLESCNDHHRVECRFCHEIVRQCPCAPGIAKVVTRDGLCGACAAQIVPPLRGHAPAKPDSVPAITLDDCPTCGPGECDAYAHFDVVGTGRGASRRSS